MPDVPLYKAVMYFSYYKQGWSESHWIGPVARSVGLATLKQLWLARLSTLPVNARGVYARIAAVGLPRDKAAHPGPYPEFAGTPPTTPPTVSEGCNDVEFAVRLGMEADNGRWATLWLRCIPDEFVDDTVLKPPLVIPEGTTPLTATTWIARLGNYCQLLRQTTFHVRELAATGTPPVRQFAVSPWVAALDRGMGNKSTGRPFGLSLGRAKVR